MKKIIAIVGIFGFFASQALTASAAYFNSEPIISCQTQITNTLRVRSESTEVYILQQMLSAAGFLNAAPNGYFGYQTQSAVKSFQVNNGLRSTGVVDEATRNAINERLCDTDLVDNTSRYNQYSQYDVYGQYAYGSSVTYVGNEDPYVRVVTPADTIPAVYPTPQYNVATNLSPVTSPRGVPTIASTPFAPNQAQILGSKIVNIAGIGYTYALTQSSGGSITVSSPVANSVYREGDTIQVNWVAQALTGPFSVSLENNNGGQSRVVTVTPSNSYSLVLTKDLLDAVCKGACSETQQDSFKVIVSVPTTDIAGTVSALRVAITPIIIKRPTSLGTLSVTASQSPANSGESFRLYINTPNGNLTNFNTISSNYTLSMRAVCPSSITVNLAGATCGQDIVIPFDLSRLQSGVPVTVTNPTWFTQDVLFQITLRDPSGQIVSATETKVSANRAPFNW